METTRFILFIALGLVLTMIWQAWQQDYPATPASPVVKQATTQQADSVSTNIDFPDLPAETVTSPVDLPKAGLKQNASGQLITVKTDVLELQINTIGGTIEQAALLDYPLEKYQTDNPILLLKNNDEEFYVIQTGLLADGKITNHKTVFESERTRYELGDQNELAVTLSWNSGDGLVVNKQFVFYRGQYAVDVKHAVINQTESDWSGRAYSQINRTDPVDKGSRLLYTYTGAVISSPDKRYEKIDFDDIEDEKLSIDIVNGWAAMLQHYFFTALVPGSKEDNYHYYTLNPDKQSYVIGAVSPNKTIVSGNSDEYYQRLYIGPKLQKTLNEIADGLELTVDYGIFWFIAKPLYWVLDFIHQYTNNWGFAIILVTLFLKLLFYRLSAAGYRSMANMRRVQPRLLSIRERYKDDRARLNKAMMDIYKEEKINPLGGCFPILIQIPVFISLYWVLLETVELRQAEFMLWIHDLSAPDPYFVLPLLMGVTMFVQQKLNPAPMDPVQEKVMSILPIVFTVFFAFFPSGLVLYWVVNNILSIAQQWFITKNIEKTTAK